MKAGDFLWIAAWTSASSPVVSSPWAFWQYSDKPIDQNWANAKWRTLDDLSRWAASTEPDSLWSKKYDAEYVSFAGGRNGWIIPLDKVIILTCAKYAGYGGVRLVQGGLSTSVTDSAMTHAGLGVGDIAVDHRSKDLVWDYTAHLNRSGIRAFPRGFGGDPWRNEQHIHWGSRENYDHAHPQLQAQIREMEGLLRRVDVGQHSLLDADDAWMRQPIKSGAPSSMCVINFLASDRRVRSGRDRCGLVPRVLRRGDGRCGRRSRSRRRIEPNRHTSSPLRWCRSPCQRLPVPLADGIHRTRTWRCSRAAVTRSRHC